MRSQLEAELLTRREAFANVGEARINDLDGTDSDDASDCC